jgi:hypothetical protein
MMQLGFAIKRIPEPAWMAHHNVMCCKKPFIARHSLLRCGPHHLPRQNQVPTNWYQYVWHSGFWLTVNQGRTQTHRSYVLPLANC